eukprot:763664-Hanusia_phi.AAC.1
MMSHRDWVEAETILEGGMIGQRSTFANETKEVALKDSSLTDAKAIQERTYTRYSKQITQNEKQNDQHARSGHERFTNMYNYWKQNGSSSPAFHACVVGAGLSGSVIAQRYASLFPDRKVLILDKRSHVGGNCFDYVDAKTGIRIHKYGPHLFHTKHQRVWDYVNSEEFQKKGAGKWIRWDHEVRAAVDMNSTSMQETTFVPVPINGISLNILFGLNLSNDAEVTAWLESHRPRNEERCSDSTESSAAQGRKCQNAEDQCISRVGRDLYQLIFKAYTEKQWGRNVSEMDPEVTARIPVHANFDSRYFQDPYQALPQGGYTKFVHAMLNHSSITILLEVNFFEFRDILEDRNYCSELFFTGPIDSYFNEHLGKLEYRSLHFSQKVFFDVGETSYVQPTSVVNHPSPNVRYTRSVEYKQFLRQKSNHSIVVYEYGTNYIAGVNEPYYPVPNKENRKLFRRYQDLSKTLEILNKSNGKSKVHFVGRLANYKYFNMDQAILNALNLFDKLYQKTRKIHEETDILGLGENQMQKGMQMVGQRNIIEWKHPFQRIVLSQAKARSHLIRTLSPPESGISLIVANGKIVDVRDGDGFIHYMRKAQYIYFFKLLLEKYSNVLPNKFYININLSDHPKEGYLNFCRLLANSAQFLIPNSRFVLDEVVSGFNDYENYGHSPKNLQAEQIKKRINVFTYSQAVQKLREMDVVPFENKIPKIYTSTIPHPAKVDYFHYAVDNTDICSGYVFTGAPFGLVSLHQDAYVRLKEKGMAGDHVKHDFVEHLKYKYLLYNDGNSLSDRTRILLPIHAVMIRRRGSAYEEFYTDKLKENIHYVGYQNTAELRAIISRLESFPLLSKKIIQENQEFVDEQLNFNNMIDCKLSNKLTILDWRWILERIPHEVKRLRPPVVGLHVML